MQGPAFLFGRFLRVTPSCVLMKIVHRLWIPRLPAVPLRKPLNPSPRSHLLPRPGAARRPGLGSAASYQGSPFLTLMQVHRNAVSCRPSTCPAGLSLVSWSHGVPHIGVHCSESLQCRTTRMPSAAAFWDRASSRIRAPDSPPTQARAFHGFAVAGVQGAGAQRAACENCVCLLHFYAQLSS